MPDAVVCELSHVSKSFRAPSGADLQVLDDVSIDVRSHEILALLGPSGCGKSTVMRILMGLITPERGQVAYRGQRLQGINPGAAMVFQGFALYPWLTVRQNIVEPLLARGLEGRASDATAERVIHLVGLTGFEDAYPRELSGGMKQRVGIARGLAVEPDILCMDEPFSQVDALTAETLRGEVIRFWSERDHKPETILMVSHDVKEVVFMATRIVVMAARPGRVRTIIENPLPYPRDPRAREFLRLVDRIHGIITEVEMPDEPAAPAGSGKPVWEPLPAASASEIIGLLEVVDDHDGRENVFRLVDEIGREFGEVLMVVKAGELLDFLDTPKQEVVLTELGRRFLAASIPERKELWRLQVLQLDVFKAVVAQTRASERQELDDDVVKSQLALHLPFEESERLFQTLVNWGRHADLFDHDPARGKILVSSTDERPPPPPSRRPPPPRPASCADLIAPEAITLALAATDRRGAIAELSRLLAGPSGLPGEQIRELLLKREDLGTTALGGGLAVPHERAEVDRVIGALGLSREGIDFGAPDGKPVRIVVALLSPMTGNNHLKALAAIAQTLADPSLRAKLLAARTAEEAHALFAQAG